MTQILEYSTYDTRPINSEIDGMNESNIKEIEKQVICLIYKHEKYDPENPQIVSESNHNEAYNIATVLLNKTIDSETTIKTYISYCETRSIGQVYLVTYDIRCKENEDDILQGIFAYKVNTEGVGNVSVLKYSFGLGIGNIKVLGIESILTDTPTKYNFILPPKSMFLEGIHKNIIDERFDSVTNLDMNKTIVHIWHSTN